MRDEELYVHLGDVRGEPGFRRYGQYRHRGSPLVVFRCVSRIRSFPGPFFCRFFLKQKKAPLSEVPYGYKKTQVDESIWEEQKEFYVGIYYRF